MFGKECGGLTHGGEIEALAVLAYRPDLVHLERIDYSSDHAHGHKVMRCGARGVTQPVLTECAFDCAYGLVWEPATRDD